MRNGSSGVIETPQRCEQGHLYLATVREVQAEAEATAPRRYRLESCWLGLEHFTLLQGWW